jgi:hypothetical protein
VPFENLSLSLFVLCSRKAAQECHFDYIIIIAGGCFVNKKAAVGQKNVSAGANNGTARSSKKENGLF